MNTPLLPPEKVRCYSPQVQDLGFVEIALTEGGPMVLRAGIGEPGSYGRTLSIVQHSARKCWIASRNTDSAEIHVGTGWGYISHADADILAKRFKSHGLQDRRETP